MNIDIFKYVVIFMINGLWQLKTTHVFWCWSLVQLKGVFWISCLLFVF